MDEYQKMIRDAKIMLQGSDARQRKKGMELLQRVAQEAETEEAKEANELLALYEPPLQNDADPELAKFLQCWTGMEGFNDHRLIGFLKKMEARPNIASRLRPEVIKTLQKWTIDVLPEVTAEAKTKKIAALNNFTNLISGITAYEGVTEFAQLRNSLFRLRLQQVAKQVDEALKQWALDEAWKLRDSLNPAPAGFEDEIKRLQEEIYETAQQRESVQELLEQFPERDPAEWEHLRLLAELIEELRHYLSARRMPDEWRRRLEEIDNRWSGAINAFIRDRAVTAVTLNELRAVWAEYERLPQVILDGRLIPEESWFQNCLEALVSDAGREVGRATNPEELIAVSNRLRAETIGTPPLVARRMEQLANEVGRITVAWKAMEKGDAFDLPPADQGWMVVPESFRAESVKRKEWLDQVEAAFAALKAETEMPFEEVYRNALQTAEEILGQSPDHELALKLQAEARRWLLCYQFDHALALWDIDGFLRLVEANSPGGIYADLAANQRVLARLAALTRRQVFPAWRDAADWWREWRKASSRLAQMQADALRKAISRQEALRREQWSSALAKMLALDFPPEEFQAAADSLKGEEGDASLHSYHRELLRKAAVGLAQRHIKAGDLESAQARLSELSGSHPNHPETIRIRTILRVEQACADNCGAVSDVLKDEWHNVTKYVDNAHAILLEAIRRAWEEDDQVSMEKLKMVITRVAATGGTAPAELEELAEWDNWLRVEQGAISESSLRNVERLVTYLKNAQRGELLNMRLKKLVSRWESQHDRVMLAWAYQAFHQIDPSIMPGSRDPVDDLRAESDQVAGRVLDTLGSQANLGKPELKDLRGSLRREEKKWEDLQDFLKRLPHPVRRPEGSEKLDRAKDQLENLIQIVTRLEQLNEADLRQEANQELLNDTLLQTNRLSGVAMRENLKQELNRWEPLTGVFYLGQRIRDTAEKCGSRETVIVLEENLFAELAAWVEKIIEKFSQAGAEGRAMWHLVSAEYCDMIYDEACLLLPRLGQPDLRTMMGIIIELHDDEVKFKQAIDRLEDPERRPPAPAGGPFEPLLHADYLKMIPPDRPKSRKAYLRFDRCANSDTMRNILTRSRSHLPEWVRNYLDNGVPGCVDEL